MDRRSWLGTTACLLTGLILPSRASSRGAPALPHHGPPMDHPSDPTRRARTPPGSDGTLEERLAAILDVLAQRSDIHGVVAGAALGDGTFRWASARGVRAPGGPAMTPETPFFIASITKLHIAAAVMRLVEEGALRLEDRLTVLLPASVTRGLHVHRGVDRTDAITVEHLLAHASGLPDFIEDYPPRGGAGGDRRSLVEILVEDGDRDWSLNETVRRVREDLRPHFPPQDLDRGRVRIRYSDTNYQLLMATIEARSGSSFAEALEGLVLEPLGLTDTWIPGRDQVRDTARPPVASLMMGDEVAAFPRFLSAIGDLNATVEDLLAFLRGMIRGHLFRRPETGLRMQARWNRFSHPLDRAALRQPSWPIQYGLGMMRFQLPRLLTPFRPVPPVVGHTGSTGTWLFHAPDLDLYLAGGVSQLTAGAVPFRFVPGMVRAAAETL